MLAITVEFLHGTFRGASADDTALMGAEIDSGEWPPSPARLYAALVAADGTGDRQRVTDGSELALLESAPPPAILADPASRTLPTQLLGRFVVADEFHRDTKSAQTGAVQEYVGRTASLVRPGTRRALADPRVVYCWSELEVPEHAERGLRARAARVGYLGCADTPVRLSVSTEVAVRLSVSTEVAAPAEADRTWEPTEQGRVALPVAWPGFQHALDQAYAEWSAGQAMRRAWLPTHFARYRSPDDPPVEGPRPDVFWLRFSRPVPGRRVRAVTEALRDAVLQGYEELSGGQRDEVPAVLHGHGFTGTGYHHAHWLALPTVGGTHPDGMIRGAAVWLPPGTEPAIVERVREVLGWLTTRELGRAGHFATGVSFDDDRRPQRRVWTTTPRRWEGPSRRWASAFPVIHERHQRGGPDLVELRRWCEHAGLNEAPVGFRTARVPLLEGALSLAPSEVFRGDDRRPYNHLEVLFDRPVRGPVMLGRGRQFGLGLMAPLPEEVASD